MMRDKGRLAELDALRGIAAMLIVVFHFTKGRMMSEVFSLGVTGVDLFFVISGFVILMTLHKTRTWKDFAVSRFSRLFPAYWFCVSFTALLIVAYRLYKGRLDHDFLLQYLANLTMFQAWFGQTDLDGPYWTMLVEMLFYLFMLSVFLLKQLKHIVPIGSAVLLLLAVYGHPAFALRFPEIHRFISIYIPLSAHFPLFLTGIVLYRIAFHLAARWEYIIPAACFGVQLLLFDDGGKSREYISIGSYAMMLGIYFLLFALFIRHQLQWIVNSATVFMGNISFSLYLVHQYISLDILFPATIKYLHLNFWLAALINLCIVLTISSLITFYIERPAMNYIRSRYKKTKSEPAPATVS